MRLRSNLHLLGVWLLATPLLFSANPPGDLAQLLRLNLTETPDQAASLLGRPDQTSDAGPNHFAWSYHKDAEDNHHFNLLLVFAKANRQLVSVTRNLPEPVRVDALFPPNAKPVAYYWPDRAKPQMKVRLLTLTGDRLMLALGEDEKAGTTGQVLLIRRGALRQFLPWLDAQLSSSSNPQQ